MHEKHLQRRATQRRSLLRSVTEVARQRPCSEGREVQGEVLDEGLRRRAGTTGGPPRRRDDPLDTADTKAQPRFGLGGRLVNVYLAHAAADLGLWSLPVSPRG